MRYLTHDPMTAARIADLEASVLGSGCGAVVTFRGVARPDAHEGRRVCALFYEAYPEMAEFQIARLVADAPIRWPVQAVRVAHRLGMVEAGECSLVVVVAASHRAEAYAASQHLIESIKREVPIWKQERYEDGTARWVFSCADGLHVPTPLEAADAGV